MEHPTQKVDTVAYISYQDLPNPDMSHISDNNLSLGFNSKEWTIQFATISTFSPIKAVLRQANKHYENTFLFQLLPKFYKNILQQVDNLRSNNSKQALTLLAEFFTHQNLNKVSAQIIRPFVNTLFLKSVNEKAFLKNQALKAISKIHTISNPHVTEQLMQLTKSNNGTISELAIKTLNQLLQHNQETSISQSFLKDLSYNINGKRSVVQKQAKQILCGFKKRVGEEKLEAIIEGASELEPEESNTLKRELKKNEIATSKSSNNLREFMKMKRNENVQAS